VGYSVAGSSATFAKGSVKTRLNKFDTHGYYSNNFVQSETATTDIFGNQTRKILAVQRHSTWPYFGNDLRLVTETVYQPDSTVPEVTVTRNGLVQKRPRLRTYSPGFTTTPWGVPPNRPILAQTLQAPHVSVM
jgi:hypothetical protein